MGAIRRQRKNRKERSEPATLAEALELNDAIFRNECDRVSDYSDTERKEWRERLRIAHEAAKAMIRSMFDPERQTRPARFLEPLHDPAEVCCIEGGESKSA